jgi:hypothetical protein
MDVQELCETGQAALMRTEYLAAERALAEAEALAWDARDFDTLSRLYMPLQEARRQVRLRAGEGVVCLDLIAQGPEDRLSGAHVAENFPHGQLLVAGWGTIEPALALRRLAREHELYVETFLAAVYPVGDARAVVIVPGADARLPEATPRSIDALLDSVPRFSVVLHEAELPVGQRRGNAATFSEVSALWERLHAPFLAAADAEVDPLRRIEAYRRVIAIDPACELAHQKLSDVARRLARESVVA